MQAPVCKLVSMIGPDAVVDNTTWTSSAVDCRGYNHARLVFYVGATDIALSALSVQESDNDSDYSDVDGTVVGTDIALDGSASDLPSATDDDKFWVFDIALQGRKRYLKFAATAGDGTTGTYAAAWAELYRPDIAPNTTAEMGAAEHLNVPEYA